jgi:hypothetical protein
MPSPALLTALAALGIRCVSAEDWPTFMHDNQRTGVTSEALRPPLALQWTCESAFPPAQGWAPPVNGYGARKTKPNVSYDDAFRVVVAGDACYFANSGEQTVYAVDAAKGDILWTLRLDTPPRLAPVWWEGKLYVGADDGKLRCLDARSGRLLWQFDAAPRPDLMLGHGRFGSCWPIRAGGIVAVADFHDSPMPGFKAHMSNHHVRMDGHLLPVLEQQFEPLYSRVGKAYGGIWEYLVFVGRKG